MSLLIESELIERLQSDKELAKDKERRQLYLSYATMFDGELANNLKLTSMELDDKYATTNPSSWLKFLRYPIVKKYIDSYMDEQAEKRAQLVLSEDAGKTRDALSISKTIHERNKLNDNSNIVVLFMPQKNYIVE